MTLEITEIGAADTHDLRRRVLRAGTPSRDVVFPQDSDLQTFHLGARDDGTLVGVSTWTPAADGAVRLRGMAVDPARQGSGVGAALVREGLRRSWQLGASSVWAAARDTALGFYVPLGFEVEGEGYVDDGTALAHHYIRLQRPPT